MNPTDTPQPLTPTASSAVDRLFPTLTDAQIARIEAHGRRRSIARGDVLVEVGDRPVPFFVVVSGELHAEAVQAHVDLGAPQSSAMHFGTLQLTTEGIDEPLRALEDACRAKQVPQSRFCAPGFGESVVLGGAALSNLR